MLAKRRGPMKGNRLINFALAAVTLLWGIPHAFKPAAAQAASLEAPHWGEGGVPQFQIDPDWPKIPSKWKVGFGSAVVGDNKGNVWILSRPRRLPKEDPRDAGEPLMAIVSIKSQHVTIYDAEGWILRAPVSSGTTGRETPAGLFSVVQKDKDHHSNLYDDAWMPNMLRITWSGIALHGGPLPGYAASHGCMRMPYSFAENLFGKTQIGMRVIIAPNDAEPVEFSDPKLFVPNADALTAAPARAETLARETADAAKAAEEAKAAAATAAREAAAAPAAVRKLEMLKTRADAELAFAQKRRAAAQ